MSIRSKMFGESETCNDKKLISESREEIIGILCSDTTTNEFISQSPEDFSTVQQLFVDEKIQKFYLEIDSDTLEKLVEFEDFVEAYNTDSVVKFASKTNNRNNIFIRVTDANEFSVSPVCVSIVGENVTNNTIQDVTRRFSVNFQVFDPMAEKYEIPTIKIRFR